MTKILAFFAIPIVPFSFLTEYLFENCKSCRSFFFPSLVLLGFFFAGVGFEKVGWLVYLLAIITSIIYTYKLFRVNSYEEWLLTYYIATVSIAWFHPEKMIFFIMAFAVPLTVIHFLLYHLKNQGATLEFEALKGIGSYLSSLPILLFLALISALVVAPAYAFFLLYGVIKENIFVAPILIALWVVWNWIGFKIFSQVFFGEPKEEIHYKDIDSTEAFPLTFLLVATFMLPLL